MDLRCPCCTRHSHNTMKGTNSVVIARVTNPRANACPRELCTMVDNDVLLEETKILSLTWNRNAGYCVSRSSSLSTNGGATAMVMGHVTPYHRTEDPMFSKSGIHPQLVTPIPARVQLYSRLISRGVSLLALKNLAGSGFCFIGRDDKVPFPFPTGFGIHRSFIGVCDRFSDPSEIQIHVTATN